MGILNDIANVIYDPSAKVVVSTKETMKILPTRSRSTIGGNSNDIKVEYAAREAGDCFWRAGVEVAKLFYIKLDDRYPSEARSLDAKIQHYHKSKMDKVKRILQEQRNDIFEAVLPLFIISIRKGTNLEFTGADKAAQDYFVLNCFYMLIETYGYWIPEFVEESEVETVKKILAGLAHTQSEKLSRQLKNFVFTYRSLLVE